MNRPESADKILDGIQYETRRLAFNVITQWAAEVDVQLRKDGFTEEAGVLPLALAEMTRLLVPDLIRQAERHDLDVGDDLIDAVAGLPAMIEDIKRWYGL